LLEADRAASPGPPSTSDRGLADRYYAVILYIIIIPNVEINKNKNKYDCRYDDFIYNSTKSKYFATIPQIRPPIRDFIDGFARAAAEVWIEVKHLI
jgi:hypothetical protein